MAKDPRNLHKQPPLSATLLAFAVAVSLGAAAQAPAAEAAQRSTPHAPRPLVQAGEANLMTRLSEAAKALMGKVERKAPVTAPTLRDTLVDFEAAQSPVTPDEADAPHLPLFQPHLLNLPPPLA